MNPTPQSLSGVYPHFTVSILPYDPHNLQGVLLWRGENVRSAKNCLSIPSGLLEHGESIHKALERELQEELGLDLVTEELERIKFHGIYENQPGDGYHWIIGVWCVPVKNLQARVTNKEPDKHDYVAVLPLKMIFTIAGLDCLFAQNLSRPLRDMVDSIQDELNSI